MTPPPGPMLEHRSSDMLQSNRKGACKATGRGRKQSAESGDAACGHHCDNERAVLPARDARVRARAMSQ